MKALFAWLYILLGFTLSAAEEAKSDLKPTNVLIIGDFISIGYTRYLSKMLKDRAVVKHNQGNAQYIGSRLKKAVTQSLRSKFR